MKVLKFILILLVVAIGAVLILASMKPNEFRAERSIVINVPAASVFEQVNDLRKANAWMPWLDADPNVKVTYDGPAAGVGASSYWNGNKNVGEGRVTIIESVENQAVRTKLEFMKPFKGVNTGDFILAPEGNGTRITWSMYGPNSFPGKVMSVFMNCQKMVGEQFDKGLNNLKTMLEKK